jgi:hypothetical protein
MWIFTKYGFFSVVCGRQRFGMSAEPDPNTVMVRARRRTHLENLKERFPDELGAATIHQSQDTDYRYRIVVPKTTFVQVLDSLGQEMTYTNFKSEVGMNSGDPDYLAALHEVWETMYGLQTKE